jgi:hypothetical protein
MLADIRQKECCFWFLCYAGALEHLRLAPHSNHAIIILLAPIQTMPL